MTNSRTIYLSLDHLVAEMASYPFAAEASLHCPVEHLCDELSGATGDLWRNAERDLVARFPSVGIDELISVRNRHWFFSDPSNRPLHTYLRSLSNQYLRNMGQDAEPFLSVEDQMQDCRAAGRRAWRWLSFMVPPDLLLAGLSENGRGPHRCSVVSPFVKRLLQEKGFAETHLHMGAGIDFASAWASAMHMCGSDHDYFGMQFDSLESPGAAHKEGVELGCWLIRAAIVRYLLGSFLTWGNENMTLNPFCDKKAFRITDCFPNRPGLQRGLPPFSVPRVMRVRVG